MDITFDNSSTATVTWPTAPAEYVFKAGIADNTPVKRKDGVATAIIIFVILATGAAYYFYKPLFALIYPTKSTEIVVSEPEPPALPTATVINDSLNVRSAPDSSKNNVVVQVHKGDVLTVTGAAEKGWLPVEYGGKTGFVSADLVKVNEPVVPTGVVPPDKDFKVTRNKGAKTLTISDYKGTIKNVIIPDKIKGRTVTIIGERAFAEKGLTNVVIPDSVTIIGENAFFDNKLTSLTIPDSVTAIEPEAFRGNGLTNVTIGNSVGIIGGNAFRHNQLTSIIIPTSVATIGQGAFYNNQLTSVIIPKSVTTIDANAFLQNNLTSITIPGGVNIAQYAFANNFTSYYNGSGRKAAGTYVYNRSVWSKR